MSNPVTPADLLPEFRILFPEFSAIVDAQVEIYLGIALTVFAKCTNATLWLAAFLVNEDIIAESDPSSAGQPSISGQITELQVDSKRVKAEKVNTSNPNDDQYMINRYGRMYVRLKAACLQYVLSGGVYGCKSPNGRNRNGYNF